MGSKYTMAAGRNGEKAITMAARITVHNTFSENGSRQNWRTSSGKVEGRSWQQETRMVAGSRV
jgi:hypothetical protein